MSLEDRKTIWQGVLKENLATITRVIKTVEPPDLEACQILTRLIATPLSVQEKSLVLHEWSNTCDFCSALTSRANNVSNQKILVHPLLCFPLSLSQEELRWWVKKFDPRIIHFYSQTSVLGQLQKNFHEASQRRAAILRSLFNKEELHQKIIEHRQETRINRMPPDQHDGLQKVRKI